MMCVGLTLNVFDHNEVRWRHYVAILWVAMPKFVGDIALKCFTCSCVHVQSIYLLGAFIFLISHLKYKAFNLLQSS